MSQLVGSLTKIVGQGKLPIKTGFIFASAANINRGIDNCNGTEAWHVRFHAAKKSRTD